MSDDYPDAWKPPADRREKCVVRRRCDDPHQIVFFNGAVLVGHLLSRSSDGSPFLPFADRHPESRINGHRQAGGRS